MGSLLSEALNELGDLEPLVGVELEFYLCAKDLSEGDVGAALDAIRDSLYGVCSVAEEECEGQYELRFPPVCDVLSLSKNVAKARDLVKSVALQCGADALFDAKPFPDKGGSAMHIHINYLGADGRNLFAKTGDRESIFFLHAIGGLCRYLLSHMRYFAPRSESYLRFQSPGMTTPTHISWGSNNRTAALRIPDTNHKQELRRIEHRVSGADSNPDDVIGAVIIGSIRGIRMEIEPPPPTYGLAFDVQYELEPLPLTMEDAMNL